MDCAREFRALLARGAELRPAGEASADPGRLVERYRPRHKLSLLSASYYLTDLYFDDNIRFFVGYVTLGDDRIYPRIFYKDHSLMWRVASHFTDAGGENWIGKGDVKRVREGGRDWLSSAEETTNLPLEIQVALDAVGRKRARARRDDRAVPLVVRRSPPDRISPYADFTGPRRRAMRRRRIHGGKPIARFRREGDPRSLRFAAGFEPDFERGVIEVGHSASKLYGGRVRKFRILSRNGTIQYQFVAAHDRAWMNPPQALTTEIMSYGVRTVDVPIDDKACVPGYEYHYRDDSCDPSELHSQIPDGYAGAASSVSPWFAEASAWIEALPVIRDFRRKIRP